MNTVLNSEALSEDGFGSGKTSGVKQYLHGLWWFMYVYVLKCLRFLIERLGSERTKGDIFGGVDTNILVVSFFGAAMMVLIGVP